MEHYVFVAPDNIIWGVGQTRKDCVVDALNSIKQCDVERPTNGKIIRATQELADDLYRYGFSEGMWEARMNVGVGWVAELREDNVDYYSKMEVRETTLRYD